MFQWVTIILAVFAAGALLVGADQVVKYFQTREPGDVPVENQLNPSPSPGVPRPSPTAAAGTSPAAQTFDSRFPGSSTVSPQAPLTESASSPTAETTQNFNTPVVPESSGTVSNSGPVTPDDVSTIDSTLAPDGQTTGETAESDDEEGIKALW